MSKKYIQNMYGGILAIQDTKLNTVVKLDPYKCSFSSFDEDYLMSLPHVNRLIEKHLITLQDERTEIIRKTAAKQNFGQKYKIGTTCYFNDDSRLEVTVHSYDPNQQLYTVRIVKTGGLIKLKESSLTLSAETSKKINIDIDENGDLIDVANPEDQQVVKSSQQSVPQSQQAVEVQYSQDNGMQRGVSAADLIKSQDKISQEISNQQAEVVYKTEQEQHKEEDEEIFLVKADKDKFAKEMSATEMMKDTQKAISNEFEKVAKVVKSTKKEESREASIDEVAFAELKPELQEFVNKFMTNDSRVKKMTITRCKDVEKLNAIVKFGDDMSKKAALAKLEKLNG